MFYSFISSVTVIVNLQRKHYLADTIWQSFGNNYCLWKQCFLCGFPNVTTPLE